MKISDILMILFTAAIAGSTIWYTIYAKRQWRAVLDSNQINREALISVQRSFVAFPPEISIVRAIDEKTRRTKSWLFYLPVENSGTTPTRDMRMHVNFDARPGELPEDFAYPDLGSSKNIPIFVAPKSKIFSSPLEISQEVVEKVQQKSLRLYFYGWTTYNDVFEKSRMHRTEFCYEVAGLQVNGDRVLTFITFWHQHNCADEECNKQK